MYYVLYVLLFLQNALASLSKLTVLTIEFSSMSVQDQVYYSNRLPINQKYHFSEETLNILTYIYVYLLLEVRLNNPEF